MQDETRTGGGRREEGKVERERGEKKERLGGREIFRGRTGERMGEKGGREGKNEIKEEERKRREERRGEETRKEGKSRGVKREEWTQ